MLLEMVRSLLRIKLSCIGSSLVDSYLLKFNSFKKKSTRETTEILRNNFFHRAPPEAALLRYQCLTHFSPMFHFSTHWKYQKTKRLEKRWMYIYYILNTFLINVTILCPMKIPDRQGFLMFTGDMKWKHWREMG